MHRHLPLVKYKLEKIQVLTEYYNKKIIEMMEKEKVQPIKDIQENGSNS